MLSSYIDATDKFNAAGTFVQDVGEWDFVVVQLVTPVGTTTFSSTNDDGAITGVSDGTPASAQNWIDVQGINLLTSTAATTLAGAGLMRFPVVGQYLRISGTSAAKVLIKLSKIE